MYLPGFHECQFNSSWFGSGANEWDSVRSARSLAEHHFQPRIPAWGYYDLSDPQVIAKQASLAREFCIDGFCIYHYWSSGTRPLKKPLEVILGNPDLDLKFSLCWANHSWYSSWKGFEVKQRTLMSQTYEKDKAHRQAHIDFLLRALNDERSMRIRGRPVLSIYDPTPTAYLADFIDHLRSDALNRFGLEIFCSAWLRPTYKITTKKILTIFDNIILNASAGMREQLKPTPFKGFLPNPAWAAQALPDALKTDQLRVAYRLLLSKLGTEVKLLDYDKFWLEYMQKYRALFLSTHGKVDAQALVNWDNTPRRGAWGSYFSNYDLDKLGLYTRELASSVLALNPDSIFYINGWNEWGEGAYLEPDTRGGTAPLQKISEAIEMARMQAGLP